MARLEPKTSTEVRNYKFDWATFLGTDTIATSDVVVNGVTLDSTTNDDTSVTVTVSSGTDGTVATIENTITTAGGLTETETWSLRIDDIGEPVTLSEAKAHLRVLSADEDAKIAAMIPRARLWVEDYTGIALVRRQFVERLVPSLGGIVRVSKAPLVTVDSVDYLDSSGASATFTPTFYPPIGTLFGGTLGWPSLQPNEAFEITYTAGYAAGEIDDRLLGAILALIEGEYSDGFAYPERSTQAAERCCSYLKAMVA